MSFGSIADDYDRVRPGPAPTALDWLVPAGCAVAVDLAAGTGLFTRALLGRVPEVVAVEPDERMRAVLTERTHAVRVLDGRGEAIPLPDASADALFVSTAWHWLDPEIAVPEIARVLRDGGRLGVLWTSRDRAEDWVAELDLLRLPGVSDSDEDSDEPNTIAEVREQLDRHHSVILPEDAPFVNVQVDSFTYSRTMRVDDVVDWLATNSAFILATQADREAGLARCRAALLERTGGESRIEIPMRSWCWRADRVVRPLPIAPGNNYCGSRGSVGAGSSPYHLGVVTGPEAANDVPGARPRAAPRGHYPRDSRDHEAYGRAPYRHAVYSRNRTPSGRAYLVTIVVLVLGLGGLAAALTGVAGQLLPRQFTAAQQQKIMAWESGKRWLEMPTGEIFANPVKYGPPAVLDQVSGSLTLVANRVGIAPQASCRVAADPAAAAVLTRNGCEAVLRATYVDGTDSYVVTVGVAPFPSAAAAARTERQLKSPKLIQNGRAPGVLAVAFAGTPAAGFTDSRRQISVATSDGPYVVMYTIGYTDGRPRVPVAADSYADAEMNSFGAGVADAAGTVLGAPPPVPHCPGAPGC
jgi:SAM-dependent methyltransferase